MFENVILIDYGLKLGLVYFHHSLLNIFTCEDISHEGKIHVSQSYPYSKKSFFCIADLKFLL